MQGPKGGGGVLSRLGTPTTASTTTPITTVTDQKYFPGRMLPGNSQRELARPMAARAFPYSAWRTLKWSNGARGLVPKILGPNDGWSNGKK